MKDIRDCLIQTNQLEQLLSSQLREIRYLQELTLQMSSAFGKERVKGGSGIQDRMAEQVAQIADLEREIKEETAELVAKKRSMREIIYSIHDPRRRMLMRMRYLENMRWEEIADHMNITPRSAHMLHRRTLEDLNAARQKRQPRPKPKDQNPVSVSTSENKKKVMS